MNQLSQDHHFAINVTININGFNWDFGIEYLSFCVMNTEQLLFEVNAVFETTTALFF